jgi:hypothetical protein
MNEKEIIKKARDEAIAMMIMIIIGVAFIWFVIYMTYSAGQVSGHANAILSCIN